MSTSSSLSSPESDLSLNEMLQILDVARAIREEQLTVDQQFQIEETRAKIRERLLASAKVAGDNVTDAEVDTAIQLYFDNLHVYRDPPWGISRLLAQIYVWRVRVVALLGIGVTAGLGLWLAFFNPSMPWSRQSQLTQQRLQVEQDARSVLLQLEGIARDDEAKQGVDALVREFHTIEASGDTDSIRQIQLRMTTMLAVLEQKYDLQIVTGAGRDSAVTREWTKGGGSSVSHYVIVEARGPGGQILPRQIQDSETGATREVTQWGEQVPLEVYERLKRDKQSDGVLNETRFGIKRRGEMQEKVLLPGADAQPIPRGPRITQW